jgi:REP-associated tyrosine transposase
MARPLRIEYDGALYHVTSRGNERKPIFRDDTDRKLFLKILSQVIDRFNWICHAYCLMNNHYHLVIETAYSGPTRPPVPVQTGHSFRSNPATVPDQIGHPFGLGLN